MASPQRAQSAGLAEQARQAAIDERDEHDFGSGLKDAFAKQQARERVSKRLGPRAFDIDRALAQRSAQIVEAYRDDELGGGA